MHALPWIALGLGIGTALVFEVHWLCVRADYHDYRRCGGTKGIWAFRCARERLKRAYRRQMAGFHEHRGPAPLAPSLGQHVYAQEKTSPPPRGDQA